MTRAWVMALFLLLPWAGCAPRLAPQDHEAVTRLWLRLHQPTPAALTARLSIHVDGPRATGRVLAELTGIPDERLLLTLASGAGTLLALVEESPAGVLAYEPERDTLTVFRNPRGVLQAQGIPLPLTLAQVARLLAGDWSVLVPEGFQQARVRDGAVEFVMPEGAALERLEVAGDGAWVRALGRDGLDILADAPEGQRSTRFTFSSPAHGTAVVRVKELALDAPLPAPLTVPETARIEHRTP